MEERTSSTTRSDFGLNVAVIAAALAVFALALWVWTAGNLHIAKRRGVYASLAEATRSYIEESFVDVRAVEPLGPGLYPDAGPERDSRPRVVATGGRVEAASYADGSSLPPDGDVTFSNFYVRVENGWVWMSESQFPYFTAFWMRVFGLS